MEQKSSIKRKWSDLPNAFCWANQFSECHGGSSKEHIVSKSILKLMGDINFSHVQQFKPISNRDLILNSSNYTGRILCKHHNSSLSHYDEEGLNFFNSVYKSYKFHAQKNTIQKAPNVYTINGNNFEKWLAKTFINAALFQLHTQRWSNRKFLTSPHSLGEKLFKGKSFSYPFGLWTRSTPSNQPRKDVIGAQYQEFKDLEAPDLPNFLVPWCLGISIRGMDICGFFNILKGVDDKSALNNLLKERLNFLESNPNWTYRKSNFVLVKNNKVSVIQFEFQ